MHRVKDLLHYGAGLVLASAALLFFVASFSQIAAASLAQGYHTNQPIVAGTVVSLTKSGSNQVQATTFANEADLLGITVDANNAIVDLQPGGSDIRVAVSGQTPVIVTNLNGDIKIGDNLIISSIAGVAAKDIPASTAKKYIAVASEAFSDKSSGVKTVSIKNGSKSENAAVGVIQAKLLLTDRSSTSSRSNPIIAFVEKLIGKPISTGQLIGSIAVFITTFSFTAFLLNGSIRGAFISLGRNPLSRPAIVSNMIRVSAVGLVILIAGIGMAYVILLI